MAFYAAERSASCGPSPVIRPRHRRGSHVCTHLIHVVGLHQLVKPRRRYSKAMSVFVAIQVLARYGVDADVRAGHTTEFATVDAFARHLRATWRVARGMKFQITPAFDADFTVLPDTGADPAAMANVRQGR